MVGLLHPWYWLVASILLVVFVLFVWQNYKNYHPFAPRGVVMICGAVLTGLLGVAAEYWGIRNGHWEYHDLPAGRTFPMWLPFAWALTFVFLYRVEELFIACLNIRQTRKKLLLAALLSATLPTWGEIVTINLGVWTYAWPLQFFGVPLLAVLGLMVIHTAIYGLFAWVCFRFKIDDPVFAYRN